MNTLPCHIKTALLSVSDKTQIVELAEAMVAAGVSILSTGGTARRLQEAGIELTEVSDVTGFPEMMDGRVKSLHPKIHGGILGKRDVHQVDAEAHGITWIDCVVTNLYPFAETIAKSSELAAAVEQIDIGGPAMLRAAAKNFEWVTVCCDPDDYAELIDTLASGTGVSFERRKALAAKTFTHTAAYDALIQQYLNPEPFPERWVRSYDKQEDLRYGENPHQQAACYRECGPVAAQGVLAAEILQGKALSYNNVVDAAAAVQCVAEFSEPCAVVVKHANPCGVAVGDEINHAFDQAWQADSLSAFGGIVALNRPCTEQIAQFLASVFVEVIIAPAFAAEALAHLSTKPNCRLLVMDVTTSSKQEPMAKMVPGGLLLQDVNTARIVADDVQCVTQQQATPEQITDALFAWHVVKHVKSNAILIAKAGVTCGVGVGQVSRVGAVEIALRQAGERAQGAVLASDAFFPFPDSIELLAGTGVSVVIQPGGSRNDAMVIEACDRLGIAMLVTGQRCFYH